MPSFNASPAEVLFYLLMSGALWKFVESVWALFRGVTAARGDDRRLDLEFTKQVRELARESVADLKGELDAMRQDLAAQDQRHADELAAQEARHQEALAAIAARDAAREAERREMILHAIGLHDWIDAGAPPPKPARPSWARARARSRPAP